MQLYRTRNDAEQCKRPRMATTHSFKTSTNIYSAIYCRMIRKKRKGYSLQTTARFHLPRTYLAQLNSNLLTFCSCTQSLFDVASSAAAAVF
jgi:hypothetical protein